MDFVIIGIAVLFALIGLIKGGAKLLLGFIMFLIIAVGAAFASAALTPVILTKEKDQDVTYTSAATLLMDPIGNALPSNDTIQPYLDSPICKNEAGVYYLGDKTVKECVGSVIPFVGDFVGDFVTANANVGDTLRTAIAYTITRYIYEFVIWLVITIILVIVRNIVRKKIFRWLDKHRAPSAVDRCVGLVLNLAIALALLWGVGALVAKFDDGSNWANKADTFMIDGVVAEPLMTNNPLLKLVDVELPVGSTSADNTSAEVADA